MSDDLYRKFRDNLNQMPIGYPPTESGVEIEILKKLFSDGEVEIALLLTPFSETPEEIALRTGVKESDLSQQLEAMAKKGLIFRIRRNGKVRYQIAPFMIGIYEYSVKKINPELARLYKTYYDEAFLGELGISDIPGFKVIPIEENIQPDQELLPHHTLENKIREARRISVAECICRKEAHLAGEGCNRPLETCLNFGVAAEYYIENGIGREIDADEAIAIIREADRAGLVHAGANSKHLSNICNCCPCCCASMKGITLKGHNKRKYMNSLYEAIIDTDACTECEACLENCPVRAISLRDIMQVDRTKCLGCGICAGKCPTGAIAVMLRKDREEPFDKVMDMGMAVLEAKKMLKP